MLPKGEEKWISQQDKGRQWNAQASVMESLDQMLGVFMSRAHGFQCASPRSHGSARRSNKCSTLVIMLVAWEEEDLRVCRLPCRRQSVSKWWCGVAVVVKVAYTWFLLPAIHYCGRPALESFWILALAFEHTEQIPYLGPGVALHLTMGKSMFTFIATFPESALPC